MKNSIDIAEEIFYRDQRRERNCVVGVNHDAVKRMRSFPKEYKAWLHQEMHKFLIRVRHAHNMLSRHDDSEWVWRSIHKDALEQLTFYKKEYRLLTFKKPKEREIGPTEIHRAKNFPLTQLLECRPSGNGRSVALCPFHQDKRPSMVLYPNNSWYCFVCSEGGDVIDYVMRKQQVKFLEAVKILINL